MQITADVNIDDIVQEVIESSDFDRAINDAVDSLVNDQVEEHLANAGLNEIHDMVRSEVEDLISRLDIDEVGDFERRAEEIARDVLADATDVTSAEMSDHDDRVSNLEQKVEDLTNTVNTLVDALVAANALLRAVLGGGA